MDCTQEQNQQENSSEGKLTQRYLNESNKSINLLKQTASISNQLIKQIQNLSSRQIAAVELINPKNLRPNEFNFVKRQNQAFTSVKNNPHNNIIDLIQIQKQQPIGFKNNQIQFRETFNSQILQKNSFMNKLFTQHKKANKINFQNTRSLLFQSLHKQSTKQSQLRQKEGNKLDINQRYSLKNTNQKIAALLSDRPFRKKSPKQPQKNVLVYRYENDEENVYHHFELPIMKDVNTQRQEKVSAFPSHIKNSLSLNSIEKSFGKTDFMKQKYCNHQKAIKHKRKQQRLEEMTKKKSFLTISDDEEQENLTQNIPQKHKHTPQKHKKTHLVTEIPEKNRQTRVKTQIYKKCQDKIIKDLVKLQKLKNKNPVIQNVPKTLKSLKQVDQSLKKVRLWVKDSKSSQPRKLHYIIRLKSMQRQEQNQKLKTQVVDNKKDLYQVPQINGFAQSLKKDIAEKKRNQQLKLKQKSTATLQNPKKKSIDKEVTGWQFQRQKQIFSKQYMYLD